MQARDGYTIGQNERHRDELAVMHAVDEISDFELGNGAFPARRCDGCIGRGAHALRAAQRAGALVGSRRASCARRARIHVAAKLSGFATFGLATGGSARAGHALARRLFALPVVAERARAWADRTARAAVVDVVAGVDTLGAAAFEATIGAAGGASTSARAARSARTAGSSAPIARAAAPAAGSTRTATLGWFAA